MLIVVSPLYSLFSLSVKYTIKNERTANRKEREKKYNCNIYLLSNRKPKAINRQAVNLTSTPWSHHNDDTF